MMTFERLLPLFLMIALDCSAAWEPLPGLPVPNGGFFCGQLGGKIVVLGGTTWKGDTKHWLDEIWSFDPDTAKWTSKGRLPNPLALGVAGEWMGDLAFAGGTDGQKPRAEVWRLTRSFELKKVGRLKKDAALATGGVVDGELIVLGGGADVSKLDGLTKGGERFSLKESAGSDLPNAGNFAMGFGASASLGNELFVFGGVRHDPVNQLANLNGAWAFNTAQNQWRSLRPFPHSVRGPAAVRLDDHRILIAGGYGGPADTFSAVAFIYDTQKDVYARTIDLPIAAAVGLVRAGEFVYCLGGEDKMKHRTDACFRVRVDELIGAAEKRR